MPLTILQMLTGFGKQSLSGRLLQRPTQVSGPRESGHLGSGYLDIFLKS